MNEFKTDANHPKEKLINTAAALVHKQGWTATGINQILSDAGIPKGSFYYYFKSKEALGVAVLQLHYANLKDLLTRTLSNSEVTPDVAVYEYLREITRYHQQTEGKLGDPIASLADEIANQSPALLAEANKAFAMTEEVWTNLIRRGQREGAISPALDPVEAAQTAMMLVSGSLFHMKCSAKVNPIELAYASIYQTLFGGMSAGVGTERRNLTDFPKLQILAS